MVQKDEAREGKEVRKGDGGKDGETERGKEQGTEAHSREKRINRRKKRSKDEVQKLRKIRKARIQSEDVDRRMRERERKQGRVSEEMTEWRYEKKGKTSRRKK